MYDDSGAGRLFRQHYSFNLAWWHSFKWAAFYVFREFAHEWWMPLHHHMYPKNAFYPKPSSFPNVINWFQLMRMGYRRCAGHVSAALDGIDLLDTQKAALTELQFLADFAISTVRVIVSCLVQVCVLWMGYMAYACM
jgi:hypothetical protein